MFIPQNKPKGINMSTSLFYHTQGIRGFQHQSAYYSKHYHPITSMNYLFSSNFELTFSRFSSLPFFIIPNFLFFTE